MSVGPNDLPRRSLRVKKLNQKLADYVLDAGKGFGGQDNMELGTII